MNRVIETLEQRQLRTNLPPFKAGDSVRVHFQVIEGQRRRVQVFEGVVLKVDEAPEAETAEEPVSEPQSAVEPEPEPEAEAEVPAGEPEPEPVKE